MSGPCVGLREQLELAIATIKIPLNPESPFCGYHTMTMQSHIDRILWNQDQISLRVSQLAAQIVHDFPSSSPPPVFVGVITGAFIFLADLVRKIDLPITIDLIRAQSYGSGTVSNCAPTVSSDLKVDINGRHVILVFF